MILSWLLRSLLGDLAPEDAPLDTYPHRLPAARPAERGDVVAITRASGEQEARVELITSQALGLVRESGASVEYRQDLQRQPLPLARIGKDGKLYVW